MEDFAHVVSDALNEVIGNSESTASALEMERLSEAAIVSGGQEKRKLMFSRPSGEIWVVTVEEGYGNNRLASLHVEVSQRGQGREVWHLSMNDKPFMFFATRDLAIQAFDDANKLLSNTFKMEEIGNSVVLREATVHKEQAKPSIWKETAKVCAVLVLTIFAVCMAWRGAANLLQTPDEKRDQGRAETWRSRTATGELPTLIQPVEPYSQKEEPEPLPEGVQGSVPALTKSGD